MRIQKSKKSLLEGDLAVKWQSFSNHTEPPVSSCIFLAWCLCTRMSASKGTSRWTWKKRSNRSLKILYYLLFQPEVYGTRICVAEPQQNHYILEQESVDVTLGIVHLLCWFYCPGIAESIEGSSRSLDRIDKCWLVLEQSQEGLALLVFS